MIKPSIYNILDALEPGGSNPRLKQLLQLFLLDYPNELTIMGRLQKMTLTKVEPEKLVQYQTSLSGCQCVYFKNSGEDLGGFQTCKHVLDLAFSTCLWDTSAYLRNYHFEGDRELKRIQLVTMIDTVKLAWENYKNANP